MTRRKRIAPTCSNSIRMDRASESTLRVFEMPSGLTMHPKTGQLWVAVNERDALGDNLVPDYVSHIVDGGFYGWPWYYTGPNQDPRFAGKHPELKEKVIVPDVLLQSHSAPLNLTFYDGKQFPAEYRGDVFVTSHGSWNRAHRTGYKIVRTLCAKRESHRRVRGFRHRLCRERRKCMGPPGGNHGRKRRFARVSPTMLRTASGASRTSA